jgi:hypothetical protein
MRLSFISIFLLICCLFFVNAQGSLNSLFGISSKSDPIGKLAPTAPGVENGLAGIELGMTYLQVLELYGLPDWISTTRPNEGPGDVLQILEPPVGPKLALTEPAVPQMTYSSFVETYKEILQLLGQRIPPKPLVPLATTGTNPDGTAADIQYDPDPQVTIEWKKTTLPLPVYSKKLADFYISQYNGGVGMPEIVVVPTTDPNNPNAPQTGNVRPPAAAPPVAAPVAAAGSSEASPTAPGFTKPAGIANFKWVFEGNNKAHPDTAQSEWLTFIEAMVQDDADPLIIQRPARIDAGSQNVYSFLRVPNIIMWQYDEPGFKTYININKVTGSVIGITVVAIDQEVVPTYKAADKSIQRIQLTSGVSFGSLISSVVDHFRYGWPTGGLMWHGSFLVLHYPAKNLTMTFGTQSGSRLRRITSITVGRAYHLTQYPTDEVKLKPKPVNKEQGSVDNGGNPISPEGPVGPGGGSMGGPGGTAPTAIQPPPTNGGGLQPLPVRRN